MDDSKILFFFIYPHNSIFVYDQNYLDNTYFQNSCISIVYMFLQLVIGAKFTGTCQKRQRFETHPDECYHRQHRGGQNGRQ